MSAGLLAFISNQLFSVAGIGKQDAIQFVRRCLCRELLLSSRQFPLDSMIVDSEVNRDQDVKKHTSHRREHLPECQPPSHQPRLHLDGPSHAGAILIDSKQPDWVGLSIARHLRVGVGEGVPGEDEIRGAVQGLLPRLRRRGSGGDEANGQPVESGCKAAAP